MMLDAGNFSIWDLQSGNQRDLYAWYTAIAEKNVLPSRADFDPLDFPRALPHLMLLDVERSPPRYRMRLVGTLIVDASGNDSTGKYLGQDHGGEIALERAATVVANRSPTFESELPMEWSPMNYKKYSVLRLPLSADGEHIDMLIYCLEFV